MCGRYLTADEAALEAVIANHGRESETCRVSIRVNKPANNDAQCIRPLQG